MAWLLLLWLLRLFSWLLRWLRERKDIDIVHYEPTPSWMAVDNDPYREYIRRLDELQREIQADSDEERVDYNGVGG
jgi:hypothetical protein